METPDGPADVAWYDFSGKLGEGTNAVFSGHLDYVGFGPAVFWYLRDLQPGDIIDAVGEDGRTYSYAVIWMKEYAASPTEGDLEEIVGDTSAESLTLITETGAFDGGQYSHRLVVRAEFIAEP